MSGDHRPALDRVYSATTPEDLADAYAEWAASYDRETAADGYCLPFLIAAWIARHVPCAEGPLLDAGCGTGLSGPSLKALGYAAIDGLDFSDEMLAVARGRVAYRNLVRATLGEPLPIADATYAAVFSTGVFTEGHAPASAIDGLARIARPGGHLIVTVRDSILVSKGFRRAFDGLIAHGWTMIEESPPFRAFAVGEPDVLVQAFVLRKPLAGER